MPAFTRRIVALPDHPRLVRELHLLERRTHVGGKDTVDHGRVGGDDYANCVFGLLRCVSKPKPRLRMVLMTSGDGLSGGIEVDPVTLQPINEQRSHLVRDSDGVLHFAGNNRC